MNKFKCTAIFLSDTIADLHYNGFSNSILWPLFHYHPGEMNFDENAWAAYIEANKKFAVEISKQVEDNDMVWVHDYHLMLLPEMLRQEIGSLKKNIRIGFSCIRHSHHRKFIVFYQLEKKFLLGF